MDKKRKFEEIARDIREVKIQGARNIARAALYAYSLIPTKESVRKLISLRPTEPMLVKVLWWAQKAPYQEILKHFDLAQEKINKQVLRLIKDKNVIFTHCHSTNVVNALIYAKKKGKKFEVYNTETRPLFQGRKTAAELGKARIKVTFFIDSALEDALTGEGELKRVDMVFLGADAILSNGVINKIGSELIARIAEDEKIPVYIIADSWKFSRSKIPIEERNLNEVWNKAPKAIKIKNPAFEFIRKKYITGIITEFGVMSYDKFIKKMMKS